MKHEKPTILILATRSGGGHLNLALSLREKLEDRYTVVIEDGVFERGDRFYTFVSRYSMQYLYWQYTLSNNAFIALLIHLVILLLTWRRLNALLERVHPQLIIVTHAYLSYTTARANERRKKRVPLVFQLTDLGELHMTWFTEKHADAYLAPSDEIAKQARRHGIDERRLYVTGRPVRRQFVESEAYSRDEALIALGLRPDLLTLFLQGGALGSAGADRTVSALLNTDIPVQILLAVGKNEHIAERYANLPRVRLIPFIEQIAPHMAAADVIVGKAGASFITEAFMLAKPFLVTSYIPGQETANLRYIERHRLGWVRLNPAAQRSLVAALASNPQVIDGLRVSLQAQRTWNLQANGAIGPIIDRLLS
ncbi:MAG TPA: glycosyltransferase [Ktedonobacteraceae bacterium]|nr:glycosyltransferase [Ktedonobacteraceae bacterium]